jgi:RHS repeat-associated protein
MYTHQLIRPNSQVTRRKAGVRLTGRLRNLHILPRRFSGIFAAIIAPLFCQHYVAAVSPCIFNSGEATWCWFDQSLGQCRVRCDLGGVYFDLPEETTCQFVLHFPCKTRVNAEIKQSDCFPYRDNSLAWPTEWKITSSSQGVRIRMNPDHTDQATIELDGSSGAITPGVVTVVATDGVRSKSGSFNIEVGSCSGDNGACSMGSTSADNGSVITSFGLGRYAFGKGSVSMRIKERYPTNLLYTPACLGWRFGTNTDCEVLTNASGIRQVKAMEGLADVLTNSASKYYINIFPLSGVGSKVGGFYQTNGAPLQTITVENPDATGNTTNRLRITDGFGYVNDYEWKTNGWELTKGGGMRREYKTVTWNSNNTERTSSSEVRDSNSQLISTRTKKYQAFPFGTNLVEEKVGNGSAILTTAYSWYTNGVGRTGQLAQVTFEDGRWELYYYETNGLKTNANFAFANQSATNDISLCRSVEYRYGSNAIPGAAESGKGNPTEPRCTVEYIQGHEVGRSYVVLGYQERRDIRCLTPGASWTNADNLVTITRWYTNATHFQRKWSVERPDGTMDIFQYAFHTNGSGEAFRTNIVLTGAPDTPKTNIVDGTRTTTVVGAVGQMVSRTVVDIMSGITTSSESYSDYDAYNRPKKITYLDGTFDWTDYGCCGPVTRTNREGTVMYHYRDAMNRESATKQNSITQTNVLDSDHRPLNRIRIGSDGTRITNATYTYNTAGRPVTTKDALGNVTSFSEALVNGHLFRTNTYPDGSTRIESFCSDGQVAQVTGTAVHPVRYDYGAEQDGGVWRAFTKEIKLDASGSDTSEWAKTYRDMLGRSYKTLFSDGAARESFYNSKGQLVKEVDPDGVTTLFAYNATGDLEVTATDLDRDGAIDYDGTDRIRQTLSATATVSSQNVRQAKSYAWATNDSAVSNLVAESRATTDGLQSWNIQYAQVTNHSRTVFGGSGNRYVTNTAPDGSYALSHFLNGQLQSVTRKNSAGTQIGKTSYTYDAHGRQQTVVDARNGATTHAYNDADQVTSLTTPAPGNGQSPLTTSYTHDWAGRIIRTVLPDGTSVTNEYWLTGELKKNFGSRTYPVQYGYDAQGRRTNMITWKNFAADSGNATTVWKYDGYRGFLTNKVYDDGIGPSYTYTPAGKLRTRTWARGLVTTYHTNAAGEIFATTYSDGTPAVTNNFDRLGRSTNIIDGAGSRFLTYNSTGQVLGETNSSGTLVGGNLRFAYDQFLRRTNHALFTTNTSLLSHSYAFDGASRITNVSDGTYQAGYAYLADSPLVSQITFRSNSTTRMTTTKSYDFLNRLSSISSAPSADSALSYSYSYNDANQRTRVTLADGSFWIYEYDKLGQVISGKRYWNDWTPVAGQQYEYAFDDIGNRTSTKAGGDSAGAGLRPAAYSANALNQYTTRDVPGAADVIGAAHPVASVTVNGQSPYRRGEYYQAELNLDNSVNPVWQSVTNIAWLAGVSETNTGNLFLPKTAESYTYDADGNLTSDGRWTNKWDGENRLIAMTSHTSGPSDSRRSLEFGYDSQSRRVSKVVSNWTGSAWTRALHEKFLYDDWNLIGVINGTNSSILKSFLWGLDLSGSLRSAGGVGGLIAFSNRQSPIGTHFAAYDGNGNVMALVDGTTGATSARYEYGPFGQTIRSSGAAATLNPVRFSSKHVDDETDLSYYGYRYLHAHVRKWLSRDPIGEQGERNLYGFVETLP